MNKILSLSAIFLIASALLVSCGESKNGDTKNSDADVTTVAEETTVAPNESIAAYDENGKYILKSTDYRYVFEADDGYVVFTFQGNTVIGVQKVLRFADSEKAKNYYNEHLTELEADENYGEITLNDSHIILQCSVFNEQYGHYLRGGTKSDVEIEFPSVLKK